MAKQSQLRILPHGRDAPVPDPLCATSLGSLSMSLLFYEPRTEHSAPGVVPTARSRGEDSLPIFPANPVISLLPLEMFFIMFYHISRIQDQFPLQLQLAVQT